VCGGTRTINEKEDGRVDASQPRKPYVLDPDQGVESWWVRGNRFDFKASAKEVGPGFAVVETLLHPVAAAPEHVHDGTDEAIHVIEGRLVLEVGDQRFEARAGSFAFPPKGIPHRYLPQEPGPVRVLWMLTPAGFENYWREIGDAVVEGEPPPPPTPPDPALMTEIGQRYATRFLP
jgi:quercetin dioxygenase-like cupin family protein